MIALRFEVATVPTVYGIETICILEIHKKSISLQQYLPFTVLKPHLILILHLSFLAVATVPTVYGIETSSFTYDFKIYTTVATVPTVYGIETWSKYGMTCR